MIGNPDDLANQLIEQITSTLQQAVDTTELTEQTMEDAEDGVLVGRRELAESVLKQINKWEKDYY
tara:strand:- start:579 stop:773 length:195 start_codon:yes stop_codon:yes gene_type:complete